MYSFLFYFIWFFLKLKTIYHLKTVRRYFCGKLKSQEILNSNEKDGNRKKWLKNNKKDQTKQTVKNAMLEPSCSFFTFAVVSWFFVLLRFLKYLVKCFSDKMTNIGNKISLDIKEH